MRLQILQTTFLFVFLNEFLIRLFGNPVLKVIPIFFLYASGILLIGYTFRNFKKIYNIHLYFKVLFILLFIWSLFIILSSINTNPNDLKDLFTQYQVGMWSWFTPLAIFFGFSIFNWIKLFSLFIKFLLVGIIFVVGDLILHINLRAFTLLSVYPVLLLTYWYHNKNIRKLIIVSAIIYVSYAFFLYSNRSSLIIFGLFIIFFIIEYLRSKNISYYKKVALSIFLSLSLLFLVVKGLDIYDSIASNKEMSSDTRTLLFVEMFSDMSETEKWMGRGALGTYYSPYFNALKLQGIDGGDSAYRRLNEIGYLHIILKGGYIMMILYLLILVPAAYLGIFKSNNMFARMSGYIILSFIIMFIIIYPPKYKIDFLILWMAVGTTLSSSQRKMTDIKILKGAFHDS